MIMQLSTTDYVELCDYVSLTQTITSVVRLIKV